ncbi:MAG: chemotaxis protein CheD [Desulfobacteraceae bacterium]|nr:chemotaxis protein CheD [Desulfobacteraceae bacterium]
MKRKREVTIHIGGYYASRQPTLIYTLVGSCVAVCMFDPVKKIGGMNHILLPGRADMQHFDAPARYGINAMELLINKIMNLGGDRRNLVAKVFGGAHLLPAISTENGVGKKIAAFVVEFLYNESIKIISRDLEGHESRKIYFHTDTGDVLLKRIKSRYYQAVAYDEERKVITRIRNEVQKPGKVTFFED